MLYLQCLSASTVRQSTATKLWMPSQMCTFLSSAIHLDNIKSKKIHHKCFIWVYGFHCTKCKENINYYTEPTKKIEQITTKKCMENNWKVNFFVHYACQQSPNFWLKCIVCYEIKYDMRMDTVLESIITRWQAWKMIATNSVRHAKSLFRQKKLLQIMQMQMCNDSPQVEWRFSIVNKKSEIID